MFSHDSVTFAPNLETMGKRTQTTETDAVLIGAGIMSATLGTLINELSPEIDIEIVERLDVVATELPDGSVNIDKAIKIAEQYEVSKQFWTYLVQRNILKKTSAFIRRVPHLSAVFGEKNVFFLRNRFVAMEKQTLFRRMVYMEDRAMLSEWMPLMMDGPRCQRTDGRYAEA